MGKKKINKCGEDVAFPEQTLLTFYDLFFLLAVPSGRSSTSEGADSEFW